MYRAIPAIVGGLLLVAAGAAQAQTLRGSRVAMERQNNVAQQHDYTFLTTSAQVQKFVRLGLLVPVKNGPHLQLAGVSHPYARPALKTLLERLSRQYHSACGEKLTVTSLTRPTAEQPSNASDLSVHPAGMAADLRISRNASCRKWLEKTLLSLEEKGVLDVTSERRPPHLHVAVFPERYLAYVEKLGGSRPAVRLASTSNQATSVSSDAGRSTIEYRVNRGDTLWTLARRFGTTVQQLKSLNNLRSSRIAAGQVISVPAGSAAP